MGYKFSVKRNKMIAEQDSLRKINESKVKVKKENLQPETIKPKVQIKYDTGVELAENMHEDIESAKRSDILVNVNKLEALSEELKTYSNQYARDVKKSHDLELEANKWITMIDEYKKIAYPSVWDKIFGAADKNAEKKYQDALTNLITIENERQKIDNKWNQGVISGTMYNTNFKQVSDEDMPLLWQVNKKQKQLIALQETVDADKAEYMQTYLEGKANPEMEYENILDELTFEQELADVDQKSVTSLKGRRDWFRPGYDSWFRPNPE